MRAHLWFGVLLLGCSDSGQNGGAPSGDLVVGFDIAGASNSTCTLVIATVTPIQPQTTQLAIGAPSPPVAQTTLDSRSPAKTCNAVVDASAVSVQAPPNVTATVTRSATNMCVQTSDLRPTLGYGTSSSCPVSLTLTCEGVVLYDHIPWSICY